MISKGNLSNKGSETNYQIHVFHPSGAVGVRVGQSEWAVGDALEVYSNTAVNDGLWHYVVMTAKYNSGSSGLSVALYVDGELEGKAFDIGSPRTTATGGLNLGVWLIPSAYGSLNGALSHVAIHGLVLSAEQVAARYAIQTSLLQHQKNLWAAPLFELSALLWKIVARLGLGKGLP